MADDTDQLGLFLSCVENTIANHEFDAWKMIDTDSKLRRCIGEHHLRSFDAQCSMDNEGYSQAALLDQLDEWTLQAEIQLMHMMERNIHFRVRIVERRQRGLIHSQHVVVPYAEPETILTEATNMAFAQTKVEIDDTPDYFADDTDIGTWSEQLSDDQVSAGTSRTSGNKELPCSWCKKVFHTKNGWENHVKYCKVERSCDVCGMVFTQKKSLIRHMVHQHPENKIIGELSDDQVSAETYHAAGNESLPCSWCKKVLLSKDGWENHVKYCKVDRSCDVCGMIFTQKASRIRHMVNQHPGHKIIERPARTFEKWPCPTCKKVLSSKLTLESHKKYCMLDRKCQWCDMVFTQKVSRIRHIINQHPEHRNIENCGRLVGYETIQRYSRTNDISHECIVCKKQFAVYGLYRQHMEAHKEQGYPCDQCDISLTTLHRWKLHRAQHIEERNFACEICSKRFRSKKTIYNHMRKHAGITSSHLCNVCGKVLNSGTAMKRHMALHSGRKRPVHSCHLCGAKFKQLATLKSHMETHDTERKFECFDCGKQASTSRALKVHMQRHGESANFKCAFCSREFYSRWALDSHAWSHSDEMRFSCSLCGKQFKAPYALKNHQRIHHDAGGFHCEICDRRFKSASGLKFHKETHDGNRERKFKCNQCTKTFFAKAGLECHIRFHRGDKPFSCTTCGSRFTTAGNLKIHNRIHTGERPFGCTICLKRFTIKHELVVHTRLHTGEKPFACTTCNYRCADKRNLSKHMRSH